MKGLLLLVATVASLASVASALVNLNLNKIIVQLGPDGTDDDVYIKVTYCCYT